MARTNEIAARWFDRIRHQYFTAASTTKNRWPSKCNAAQPSFDCRVWRKRRAAGPLALVSTTGWTGADLIVGPAGQVATDARNPAAGRVAQGAGMVAAAATTPSFMRQSSGRSGTTETADSSAATDSTDPGTLILAGLGLVGLLALRRRDDG